MRKRLMGVVVGLAFTASNCVGSSEAHGFCALVALEPFYGAGLVKARGLAQCEPAHKIMVTTVLQRKVGDTWTSVRTETYMSQARVNSSTVFAMEPCHRGRFYRTWAKATVGATSNAHFGLEPDTSKPRLLC